MPKIMKDNRKTRYTRRALRESYIELLSERPDSRITVSEVCERADINKGTFYNHYDNIEALKSELDNEICSKINDILGRCESEENIDTLKGILDNARENIELYKLLVYPAREGTLLERVMQITWEHAKECAEEESVSLTSSMYNVFILYAMLGCWVKMGCKEDTEKVASCMDKISSVVNEYFGD